MSGNQHSDTSLRKLGLGSLIELANILDYQITVMA